LIIKQNDIFEIGRNLNMKLAIFGATGRTGRHLVEQAVEGGHTVTVLLRTPAAFPMQHERLTIIQGDVRDAAAVEATVAGQDAVLSALGTNQRGPVSVCTDGIQRILTAMTQLQVRRLLVVSAYGAMESHHRTLYNLFLWTLLKGKMVDKERMEELITRSDVDWTLIRPPRLSDGPPTRQYRSGPDLRMHVTSRISRADVAAFMLHHLKDAASVHKALAITA
jgi:putative NADH-flavin reductase